ncbi:protein YIPF6-like [Centruroides vittatus]|uniref:protein YIPF6-like n=1 Tax=Centruroides vittatus TaxID=120091 RepID=UPI0035100C2C
MAKMEEVDFVVHEHLDTGLQESGLPSYQYDSQLEGEIVTPETRESEFNTLDEPVKETIKRDLKAVGLKFFHVLYPKQKKALLQDWDLWGSLILCVFLALMLHGSTIEDSNESGMQFAEIFTIVWCGAFIVTINSKFLGGTLSIFQSVCVLGYCLLAPCISLIFCVILSAILPASTALFIIKFVISLLGFGWAVFASVAFLGDSQPPRRKALAVYPIFLFYLIVTWLIVLNG